MKLSFVIPAYNEENNISACLSSIIEECRKEEYAVEIIVVDNACTDRTAEIAASFPGVNVIREQQKGIVWARRAGYLASSGDLIANVDADIMLLPGWLKRVIRSFRKDEKLIAMSGPHTFHDLSPWVNMIIRGYYAWGYVIYLFTNTVLHTGAMLQGGNYVIKRSVLDKIGGYDTSIIFYGEDSDVAMRIRKLGHIKFDFGLKVSTTGRRLAEEGLARMGIRYGLNYIWIIIFKRPFSKEYRDIRKKS